MTTSDDPVAVVQVKGALRAPGNTALRKDVETLLRRGKRRIVVDLAGVSTLDAAGVGELVQAYNLTAAAHGTFRVTHPAGHAREVLGRVGLLPLLAGETASRH